MKKILNILWSITLIGTSTTSLVACNTPQYIEDELKTEKEKHKIDTKNQTIRDNLEWISPQEKSFNNVDNKYYYVVWRENKNVKLVITKFKNDKKVDDLIKITNINNWSLCLNKDVPYDIKDNKNIILFIVEDEKQGKIKQNNHIWQKINDDYFKSVYRWNSLDKPEPDLVLDDKDNIKVKD
ncbi:lipoprotein [Spiroplasma endosymbiont of Polydrusus pterygomalis]|uniref:lipoprotein n=1 Tax=Spiroplasma endosymbiont of Polydrusus pterygomalis TaxID=3139327 RepID=UPI003CCAD5BE